MALNNGTRVASLIREDLDRLHQHVIELVGIVGGSIGSAISARIDEPLASVKNHLTPLLDLLAGVEGTPKRGPGRPRKSAIASAPAPKRRRRRGSRGRRANITPEILEAALREANGVKTKAAEILRVSQPTLYKYIAAFKAPSAPSKPSKAAASKKPTKKRK